MGTLLIRNAWLDGRTTDVLISDGRFRSLTAPAGTQADKVVEAAGMALLPPFYNTHTHAAMSLLRGYADDMPLQKWLQEYVWPYENKMTRQDIREGTRMALREMIRTAKGALP